MIEDNIRSVHANAGAMQMERDSRCTTKLKLVPDLGKEDLQGRTAGIADRMVMTSLQGDQTSTEEAKSLDPVGSRSDSA